MKQNAQQIAEAAGLEIEFIRRSGVRKEAVIESIIKKRGTHPGMVHIILEAYSFNEILCEVHIRVWYVSFL
ncbi:MAG TPA: hypothetical protein VMU83_23880 [Hanamia sp.]|nr:hypothetical protein [Hanamia sp.]